MAALTLSSSPALPFISNRPLRIGLLGPYGAANLGDNSIQTAVMRALRERLGPIDFLGIASNPYDVSRMYGIAAVDSSGEGPRIEPGEAEPAARAGDATVSRAATGSTSPRGWLPRPRLPRPRLPRPLRRLIGIRKHVASLDLLIISGSGQIDDFWGGPWEQPFGLWAWSRSARRLGIPVGVFGIGVDELTTRLGAWFSLRAMHLARFRAFRDPVSVDILRSLGLKADAVVCPDPAFGLQAPDAASVPPADHKAERPFAVISPIARNAWPGPHDAAYEGYLAALARVAEKLQAADLQVRFACSQTRMDPVAVKRVMEMMRPEAAARSVLEPIAGVEDYMRVAAGAQVVLATRLHAAILALAAGAPVVAIAYSRKGHQVMRDFQVADCCIGLREADAGRLWALVEDVLSRREALRSRIAAQHRRDRERLAACYDGLVEAVTPELRKRVTAGGVPARAATAP